MFARLYILSFPVLAAVSVWIVVYSVVTRCHTVAGYHRSNKHAASILSQHH
jgi:hypothetical protein